MTTTQRPLPPDAIAGLSSIAEACDVLRAWGHPDLAERLAYFASDADLEEGDERLTLESAQGFLSFFGAAESDAVMHLGCTQEGWICAEWDFFDKRGVGLWFLDASRTMYTARDVDGNFLDFNLGSKVGDSIVITEKLVGSGLFTWYKSLRAVARSPSRIT